MPYSLKILNLKLSLLRIFITYSKLYSGLPYFLHFKHFLQIDNNLANTYDSENVAYRVLSDKLCATFCTWFSANNW